MDFLLRRFCATEKGGEEKDVTDVFVQHTLGGLMISAAAAAVFKMAAETGSDRYECQNKVRSVIQSLISLETPRL